DEQGPDAGVRLAPAIGPEHRDHRERAHDPVDQQRGEAPGPAGDAARAGRREAEPSAGVRRRGGRRGGHGPTLAPEFVRPATGTGVTCRKQWGYGRETHAAYVSD